jgi:hypothetical protein
MGMAQQTTLGVARPFVDMSGIGVEDLVGEGRGIVERRGIG